MNYMDYVNDNCMNAFTTGQGNYMQTILSTSRSSLAGSSGTACAPAILPLEAIIVSLTNATCFAGNDGSIVVEATGGSPIYTYTLNTGQSNNTGIFNNLTAGIYTIDIHDTGGQNISIDVTVEEPTMIEISLDNLQNNVCFNGTAGSITVSATGGTSVNGTYLFSLNQGTPQSNNTFSNLPNGDYTIDVYDDNDCIGFAITTISSPPELVASSISQQNVSCFGGNNGLIHAGASGGVPGYSFTLGNVSSASGIFANLIAGSYVVKVTDQNACTDTRVFIITQPGQLTIEATNIVNVACSGGSTGSVTLVGHSGTPAYQFSLNGTIYSANPVFTGLSPANYSMFVQDNNNCISTGSFVISSNLDLIVSVVGQTNVQCAGDTNGSVTVQGLGGLAPYSYTLNTATNTTGIFNNLSSGTYNIKITDAVQCIDSVSAIITENSGLLLSVLTIQNVSCFGASNGALTVMGQGGSGNFTYSIDGTNFQSSNLFSNLPAGNYVVTMSDGTTCTTTASATIQQPALLILQASTDDPSCNGGTDGSISGTIAGGTPVYSLTMNSAPIEVVNGVFAIVDLAIGLYNLNLTDANGCSTNEGLPLSEPAPLTASALNIVEQNCSIPNSASFTIQGNGGTPPYSYALGNVENFTGNFGGLNAGIYSVVTTDAHGCVTINSISIPLEGGLQITNLSSQNISCHGANDGVVQVSANNSSSDVSYALNGQPDDDGIFQDLAPGTYVLLVTDENTGCAISDTVMITEPDELVINIANIAQGTNIGTNKTTFSVAGGTGPYTIAVGDRTNIVNDSLVRDLLPNSYNVWVEDARGCKDSTVFIITATTNVGLDSEPKIYPNPFAKSFTIELQGVENQRFDVLIYTLDGKLVYIEKGIKFGYGKNNHIVFTENLESSIYILKIATESKLYIRKIFKD